MSQHDLFFFPKEPHRPPPDWPAVEKALLAEEIILPAVGSQVPWVALHELSFSLCKLRTGQDWLHDKAWRSTGDVIDAYKAAGLLSPSIATRHDRTVAETVSDLRNEGIVLDDEWCLLEARDCSWGGVRHRPGPGLLPYYDRPGHEPVDTMALTLLAFEGKPVVLAGESLHAPCLPGTDEPTEEWPPFGDYTDFIGATHEDPNATWTDPRTGRRFHLLDLDWKFSLGFGYRFLMIEHWAWFNHSRFAERLAELIGQPMTYTYRHL